MSLHGRSVADIRLVTVAAHDFMGGIGIRYALDSGSPHRLCFALERFGVRTDLEDAIDTR
jgi:hypothetical protein